MSNATDGHTVTHTLLRPITVGKKTVKELTFREAELDDLMVADAAQGGTGKIRLVLAQLSGQSPEVIGKLKAKDLQVILEKTDELTGGFFS
ncbi:MAG: phage tail assembly protein [Roseibium sp.]